MIFDSPKMIALREKYRVMENYEVPDLYFSIDTMDMKARENS